MARDEALSLLRENMRNENLVKHCLASEAIMRALAQKLGQDEDTWALAGLLHDIDFEQTSDAPDKHGLIGAEILAAKGLAPEIIDAVKAHNADGLGLERSTEFHHALACAETITGLVVATALVYPDKKLASVKASSVKKRMKKKDFARNVSRETIMECEKIGLSLDEFVEISLTAMQGIAEDLGL